MKNIIYLFIASVLFTACNTDGFSKLKSGGNEIVSDNPPAKNLDADKKSDDTDSDPFANVPNVNSAASVNSNSIVNNSTNKYPIMTFDKKVHDFGNIIDGQAQETVFNYTNTGDAPLVISEIKSTCGCTVPQDWSRAPLLPGESSKFTVKFNGKGANKTSKTVTIKANTKSGSESVRISAFINKPGNGSKPAGPIIQ